MNESVGALDAPAALRTGGLWRDALRRLTRKPAAVASAALVCAIALLSIVGPLASPHAPDALDWQRMAAPPQLEGAHWLGTDRLGRDLFVRTLHGVRVSLLIALLSSAVSLAIGVTWGMVAGFRGGRTDRLMMRFVDVLYTLPYIFIVIILTTLFERGNLAVLFFAIGAVGWLTTARIVRGQTLSLRRREFIDAAVTSGVGSAGIIARHILPNVAGPVVIYATLTIPQMILFESFLSFLGLGVQEPLASLGSLINEGAQEMESAPWMLLVPATVLAALLLAFNTLGDALRDALEPGAHGRPGRRQTTGARRQARTAGAATDDVLRIENLSVTYPGPADPVHAVREFSLSVRRGECVGIVGESGAGKTQALLAVAGLLPADAQVRGSARVEGRELVGAGTRELNEVRGTRLAMIFQDPMTSLTPHMRVGEQIGEPLRAHRGLRRREARKRALALLERVHVNDARRRLDAWPHELSGGMRQRVMIAMALACEPALLVADEPTTALDVTIQAQILALLAALKRDSRTGMVLITHDFGVVAGLADRVAVMSAGRIVEVGPVRTVLRSPQHPYTRSLLEAMPRLGPLEAAR